jgi:N12 class adenine-specific DNA methylase
MGMKPRNVWAMKVEYEVVNNEDGIRVKANGKYWQDKVFDNLQSLIGHVYICINKLCADNGLKNSDVAFTICYDEHVMDFGYEFEDATDEDIDKIELLGFSEAYLIAR